MIYLVCFVAALCLIAVMLSFRKRRRSVFGSYVDPKLVKYVLDHPAEAEAAIKPQLRDVTIMFTNLTDSTGLFRRLGDLGAAQVLRDYWTVVVPIIRRHQGYICKLLGDGMMVLFGAPRTNAEHARCAVAATLEMQRALDELNDPFSTEGKPNLRMRVGVVSGMAVVGDVGTVEISEYTACGDMVNLAMRLEKLNKATSTRNLVSGPTAAQLEGLFEFRPVSVDENAHGARGMQIFEAFDAIQGG